MPNNDQPQNRFRCPACGFAIFNRRIKNCESCKVDLPPELLFTSQQIAELNAQHERSRKERAERELRDKQSETSWGGDGSCGDSGGD